MRFWWVNQNQTFRQELDGGYMWSPKRKSNGHRNHFYETMREVAPGDLVLSFVDTFIHAVGYARSYCYESPKPTEFGTSGKNWADVGWKVDVSWTVLQRRIRPKDLMGELRGTLPAKYSPIRENGDGLQSVYLAELPEPMFLVLANHVGSEITTLLSAPDLADRVGEDLAEYGPRLDEWESHISEELNQDTGLDETTRSAVIQARRGQGLFRKRVGRIERSCRITKVENPTHLLASHCKPWRHASNDERLDGENGLLLTPTADHLFDRGFISFSDTGSLIVSPVADQTSLGRMHIPEHGTAVGSFSEGQKRYLEYHRNFVFLETA